MFHIDTEGNDRWIIGEAKGYVGPPSQITGVEGGGLAPPWLPSSYAYVLVYQRRNKLNLASFSTVTKYPQVDEFGIYMMHYNAPAQHSAVVLGNLKEQHLNILSHLSYSLGSCSR